MADSVDDALKPSTAVLLVHGIGEQKAGATLDKFLTGVQDTLVSPVDIENRPDPLRAVVRVGESIISVREVWWADLLGGDAVAGTFRASDFNAIAWFPWLNWRFKVAVGGGPVRVVAWTIMLGPLACLLQVVGWVIVMAASLVRDPRILFDSVLADVTNYTASAGHAAPDGPVADAADAIQERFVHAVTEAVVGGASRVVVVAHSLGTVIAYHGISGVLDSRSSNTAPILDDTMTQKIDTLISIGSPLEKIRWIWPTLVGPAADLQRRAPALRWTNLRDRLDIVSGKLRHRDTWGEVTDVAVFGRAWLATAHTAYDRNPEFVRVLATELGYPDAQVRRLRRRHQASLLARSIGYSLGAIVGLLLVVCLALAVAALAALLLTVLIVIGSFIDGGQLGLHAATEQAQIMAYAAPLLMGAAVLVWPIIYGRVVASYQHYAFRYGEWPATEGSATNATKPEEDSAQNGAAKDTVDSDQGSVRPAGRWRRKLRRAALTVGYVALSYPVGIVSTPVAFEMASAQRGDPFDPDSVPSGHSPGVVVLEVFEGMLALPLIAIILGGIYALVVKGVPTAYHAYRQWVLETTRPPTVRQPVADRGDAD